MRAIRSLAIAVLVLATGSLASAQDDGAEPAVAQPPTVEPPPGEDYLRAALEDLGFLAGGIIWYVIDDRNVLDWDLESWDERFSEHAYRFDNNHFPINFIGHPMSGAAFYGIPRANGLSMPAAAAYGIVSSFLWEFFIEFKERFSINDSIATPLGGIAIGEPLIRMGRFFDREAHPVLAWILGLPVAIHEALDGRAVGYEGPPRPDRGFHELRAAYGFGWAVGEGTDFDVHTLTASARFVDIPRWGRVARIERGFYDAEVSSIVVDGFFSSTGAGFELSADTVLAGFALADLAEHGSGLHGASLVAGTSVPYFYRWERYEGWHDRLAFSGFPGLAVDAEDHAGWLTVRFAGRFHGGFGGAHAPTFPAWEAENEGGAPKTILTNHGYYFGWGWLGRLELEARARLSEDSYAALGGSLAYLTLDSQQGLDRRQDLVMNDILGHDELLEVAAWARARFPYGVFVEASVRAQMRHSVLDGDVADRELVRYRVAIGLEY